METLFSSIGDDLRHTVGTVGRVESTSTFPTITTVPTKTIFNGNVCLGRSAAIADISFFLLNHVSATVQWELRKKVRRLLSLVPIWSVTIGNGRRPRSADRRRPLQIIWKHFYVVSATHPSQTVSDRRRPLQIIWTPGLNLGCGLPLKLSKKRPF